MRLRHRRQTEANDLALGNDELRLVEAQADFNQRNRVIWGLRAKGREVGNKYSYEVWGWMAEAGTIASSFNFIYPSKGN